MAVVAKWLTHRIVAPARVGSIPTYRPSKKARAIACAFCLLNFSKFYIASQDFSAVPVREAAACTDSRGVPLY